jgi:hypothetical protein
MTEFDPSEIAQSNAADPNDELAQAPRPAGLVEKAAIDVGEGRGTLDPFPLGEDLHPPASSYIGGREDSAVNRRRPAGLTVGRRQPVVLLGRAIRTLWMLLSRVRSREGYPFTGC